MKDSDIIALYFERNEQAIKESSEKYGSYCFSVANAVLSNRDDSEECVNSTWLKAWNTIPPQKPNVLKMYFAKITRNTALSAYRKRTAQKREYGEFEASLEELKECLSSKESVEQQIDKENLNKAVNSFLKSLNNRDCSVFLRRYFYSDSVRNIAVRYSLSESNTLSILFRTRKKLREYLIKEGFSI